MATCRIRRILVAVKDPSAAALPAVTKAAQLAKALGAELTLFQALSTPLNLGEDLPPRHMVLGTLGDYTRSAHEAVPRGPGAAAASSRDPGDRFSRMGSSGG